MSIEIITEVIVLIAGLLSIAGFARDVRKDWAAISVKYIKSISRILLTLCGDLLFLIIWLGMNRLLDYMVLRLFPMDAPTFLINVTTKTFEVTTFIVVLMFIVTDVIRMIAYLKNHNNHAGEVKE